MTQLVIDDTIIDIKEPITYNFQVGDIAEISLSKSTYTSSFKIPRTIETIRLFDGLGVPGDTSKHPYRINNVSLLDDYVPVMQNAVLVFLRTEPLYYNVTVLSGTFDFFTEIGDTKFSDIDISEIVHEKTLGAVADNIAGTFPRNYTYGFAYFGGLSHYTDEGGPVTVNIDCMAPAVRAKYLWDQIFKAFPRFSFSGDFYLSSDFNDLWVACPYGAFADDGEAVHKAVIYKRNYTFTGSPVLVPLTADYDLPIDFVQLEISRARTYALTQGLCRVNIDKFFAEISVPEDKMLSVQVWRNSEVMAVFEGSDDPASENMGSVDIWMETGDFLSFVLIWPDGGTIVGTLHDLSISLSRVTATQQTSDKVFGLPIRTFIKEIMWRYGLLAFVENNHIDFVMMKDVIGSSEVVNWSDKYSKRTEEEYTLDYNQNNWLRHKYGEENVSYFDKNIQVDNKNLQREKTIIQSEFYAPFQDRINYRTYPGVSFPAIDIPVFEPDIREIDFPVDEEIEYKKQNRYFFVRMGSRTMPYRIGSVTMGGVVDVPSGSFVHVFTFDDLSFSENTYYDALLRILDQTRVHRVELTASPVDINQLSLRKLYYFEQEGAYYMLNKLQYKKDETSKGEFIKIR